jgi:hypothetical protein
VDWLVFIGRVSSLSKAMPTPDDGVYVQFSGGAKEIFFGFELGVEREGLGGIVPSKIT